MILPDHHFARRRQGKIICGQNPPSPDSRNADFFQPSTAWVTIDNSLHDSDDKLTCRYSTDPAQIGQTVTVESRNGKSVQLTLPPAGFVIYQ